MTLEKYNSGRIVIIDSLRGFALAGVAMVHMNEQFIASPAPDNFIQVSNELLDQILNGIITFFIVGKFFALFSILFGLSFCIQMQSATKKGQNFGYRFLWRAVLLFLIGYLHQLFYKGDILTIYALLAPFLIPFYRFTNKWILLVAGLFLLSLPRFIAFIMLGNESAFGLPPLLDANNTANVAYITTLKNGSIFEVFTANSTIGMLQKMDFQIGVFARFYLTFGYFLIGLWLGKIELFRNITKYIPIIKKWLIGAIIIFGIGLLTTAGLFSAAPQPRDFTHWFHILGINAYDWSNTALTVIIICSFILMYQKKQGNIFFTYASYYGRMALTNYVLQSIIGTFLLFGWGLGLLGQLQTRYLVLLAITLIILQTVGSKLWLTTFRYGPLEWLWRSATYGKIQKLRK